MFDTLSDRLTSVLSDLRGKGRLSETDIDTTCREIRIALLEADVALPVVRAFVAQVKERAKGAEVSEALNPAQQVVKIVNEELVGILGGETRRLRLAKNPPTVIMLAGLQGCGQDDPRRQAREASSRKDRATLRSSSPADLQRPNAVTQLQVVGAAAPSVDRVRAGARQRRRRPGRRRREGRRGRFARDKPVRRGRSSTPPDVSVSTPS